MNNKKSVELILVRHGEALSNATGILSSYPESTALHLTQRGEARVYETADRIAGEYVVDAIIASPITRTLETANIISSVTGVEVQTDIRLREVDFGVFNHSPAQDFFAKYQDPVLRIHTTGEDGVESLIDVRKRVQSFLEDVLLAYESKVVVIVSHMDTIAEMLAYLQNQNEWVSAHNHSLSPGEMKKVSFSRDVENLI